MGLKSSVLKAGTLALRFLYAPMKMGPMKDRVVIISRQSDKPTLDIRLIRDWMRENHPEIPCVTLCRKLEGTGKLSYAMHMFAQMRFLATSRVVLLDGYCIAASVLNHREETTIVQMWHALAAIKKFGYQSIGKAGGRSPEVAEALKMHRNYDYITAPSEATGKHFAECFGADTDKLVYRALPRVDEILRPDRIIPQGIDDVETFRSFMRERFSIPEDKEILLYVPTFRRDRQVEIGGLAEAVDPARFVLVVKLHPLFDEQQMKQDAAEGLQIIMDREFTSYQWLTVCDRVVTDYSALGVEAALTGKPLYYYVYDIDEYERSVGLNVDPLEEMPSASAVTPEKMRQVLDAEYDYSELERFRDKYVSVDTDNCTEDLGEFLVQLMKESND